MKQIEELITDEVPLACTLTETEQVTRKLEGKDLFKHVQQINELADGYALRFPGDDTWANDLLQFITFERACCQFFTFALVFEPKQGPIWLHIRGPEGVKTIIEGMILASQWQSQSAPLLYTILKVTSTTSQRKQ